MEVLLTHKAEKEFNRLPSQVKLLIAKTIDQLQKTPFPKGYSKLTNRPGYRVRVGKFRLLYLLEKVEEKSKLIIVKIAHRREVYNCSGESPRSLERG